MSTPRGRARRARAVERGVERSRGIARAFESVGKGENARARRLGADDGDDGRARALTTMGARGDDDARGGRAGIRTGGAECLRTRRLTNDALGESR
jgi:hypothetical protein